MGKITVLYENYSDDGILSGGSYQKPLSNAQASDIGRVARTTDAATTSTVVNIDLGISRQVGGIAVGPMNVSPGAQYRFRAYSDFALTDITYDSGIKSIGGVVTPSLDLEWEDPGWWFGLDINSIDNIPTWLFEIIPTESLPFTLTQWFSVEVFDTANAAGYIEFGRILVARAWTPSHNYSIGDNNFTIDPRTTMKETVGGRRIYDEQGQRRLLRVSFDNLMEDDLFRDVFRMMNRNGTSRQVYVVPDPDDNEFLQRRSFLATLKSAPAIVQVGMERGNTALDFEEVL